MDRYKNALSDRPVLYTPRLVLRTPTEQDLPSITAIAGDWEVASRLARLPHPYSAADSLFFLNEVVPAQLVWVIVEQSSEQVVGALGLSLDQDRAETVELGYYVAREHWGRGFATEAGSAILAYGIGLIGRSSIKSGFFSDNPASGRVLEKLGFRTCGVSERSCLATRSTKPYVEMTLNGAT